MKVLKYLGIGVIGLVLIVLILGLIAPTKNHVERSVVINASIDQVRPFVTSFEGMYQWSPWKEYDPNQETSIQNDGAVGALYSWDGNDDVGAGTQEITLLEENKVVTHLHFFRPFESEADATTTIEEVEGGVKVTWAYDDESPFPMNAMNLMFDMDEMLGPDFERGMNYLKEKVESMEPEKPAIDITETQLEPRTYIGRRATKGFDELEAFFGATYGEAFGAIEAAGIAPAGMPSAVYYSWNEETMTTELLAGIPISEGTVKGFDTETISGPALMVVHQGAYDKIGEVHEAFDAYVRENNIPVSVAIEEYVTDPGAEPDTAKWITHVYYVISDEMASEE